MAITHITIGANDNAKSVAFYEAVLAPLGYQKAFEMPRWTGFSCGESEPPIMIGAPFDGGTAIGGNGLMIGFAAPTRAAVREAHEAGLKLGGKDEGSPGSREGGPPNNYGAYLRDPAGNKISIFCMAPGE